MFFGSSNFLWFLFVVPGLALFMLWAFKKKKQLIDQFVSDDLKERLLKGVSPTRQKTKAALVIIALGFAILSLARPKYGFHWEEVQRRGIDIVIALDVSKSMLAEDVSPNRLERAKREIIDLINLVEGDRLGLVAFSGTSFLQCPLTLDYGAVQIFLDELDTDIIPIPGTAISDAIQKSLDAFDKSDKNSRAIILITDGEDHNQNPVKAAEAAAEKNVKIYTVGIGQEGGAPIPDRQNGGFKKNRRGEVIMTKLDESSLQKIALATGGSYVRSITGNLDLENIYKDIRNTIEDKELQSGRRKRYEERFQWPLLIALLLLVIEPFVSERVPQRRQQSLAQAAKTVMILLAFFCGWTSTSASAFTWPSFGETTAETDYTKGDYANSLKKQLDQQVEEPDNQELKYNLGNSYYKMGDYQNAEKQFMESAISGDDALSQKSFYNLGNTAFQLGKLQESIQFYEKALELDPNDDDAKHNIEYVREEIKRRIEEQKQRQQQNQQPQNQDQNQEQDQNNQQQNEQNQQQAQDQKKQNDSQQNQQQQNQASENQEEGKESQQDQETAEGSDQDDSQNEQQGQAAKESDQDTEDKQENQEDMASAGNADDGSTGEQMSEEEAMRWLSTLNSDRKEFLKKKFKGKRGYQVEKDW